MKRLKKYLIFTIIISLFLFSCSTNNKNTNNNLKISFETRGLKIVKPNEINKKWEWIVEPTFEYEVVGNYSKKENRLWVWKTKKNCGYVDKLGNIVIPFRYDAVWDFSEGLAAVSHGNSVGIIDTLGNLIIPFEYQDIYSIGFKDNIISVKNWKWGCIDSNNNIVIPFKYDNGISFHDGLARVSYQNKNFYIDKTGRTVLKHNYRFASFFSEGFAEVSKSKSGYINKKGKLVIPLKFDGANPFQDGLAVVKMNNKNGYIDTTGKVIIPIEYDYADWFKNGIAVVEKNGKRWFIDKKGNAIFPDKYENAYNFNYGLAQVEKNQKIGYIDKSGNLIIPYIFDDARNLENGLIWVKQNNKWGIIKLIKNKEKKQVDNNPPILTIENNNITETSRGFKLISEGKITLKGTILDESGVKEFTINGNQYEGNNYTEIDFSVEISGDANIHISATDSKGNNTEKLYSIVKPENNYQNNPQNNINSDKRLALVIGNSDYKNYPLKNPVNDANDMANVLEEIGFDVIKFTDTDFSEMNDAVDEFGEKLKNYSVGLFFYAGHGMQVDGENYLIPVDASLSNEGEVKYKCLAIGIVLAKMEATTNTNILLLDACRNNPFERSWSRSIQNKGLASINAPSGTFIGFATSPGDVASDGTNKNGIYTEAILTHINKKDLTIYQLFNKVNKTVSENTNNKQVPWISSSLSDDFYFNN